MSAARAVLLWLLRRLFGIDMVIDFDGLDAAIRETAREMGL